MQYIYTHARRETMPYTNKYKILNYGSAKKRRNEHVSEIVLTYKIDVLGHNNPLTQKTYKKLALICKNNGDTYNALKYARFTSMYDKINSFYKFEPTCVENYDSLKVTNVNELLNSKFASLHLKEPFLQFPHFTLTS